MARPLVYKYLQIFLKNFKTNSGFTIWNNHEEDQAMGIHQLNLCKYDPHPRYIFCILHLDKQTINTVAIYLPLPFTENGLLLFNKFMYKIAVLKGLYQLY